MPMLSAADECIDLVLPAEGIEMLREDQQARGTAEEKQAEMEAEEQKRKKGRNGGSTTVSTSSTSSAPEAGRHGWSGSCDPANFHETRYRPLTFSVSCLQWLPKASGKGLKKGPTLVRVRGLTDRAELVYKEADKVCGALNRGVYGGPKTIRTGFV